MKFKKKIFASTFLICTLCYFQLNAQDCDNLLVNNGFEDSGAIVFNELFLNIPAYTYDESTAQPIPNWALTSSSPGEFIILNDINNEVNNPEGDKFVLLKAANQCAIASFLLDIPECYKIEFDVAFYNADPNSSLNEVEFVVENFRSSGAPAILNSTNISSSTDFYNLNWQTITLFNNTNSESTPNLWFSVGRDVSPFSGGVLLDNVKIQKCCDEEYCSIDSYTINTNCNDNGTIDNPKDDTYTFELVVNGTGTTTGWLSNLGAGSFGQPITMGPFNIYSGDFDFEVSCIDGSSMTIEVIAPPACSVEQNCDFYTKLIENNCCKSCPKGNVSVNTAFPFDLVNEQTNLAYFKPSIISSMDRITGSNASFATDENNLTITQTATETDPWWEVDLLGFFDISSIDLGSLNGVHHLLISQQPFTSYHLNTATNQAESVHITTGGILPLNQRARYIRIYRPGKGELILNNIKVFGSINNTSSPYQFNWSTNNPTGSFECLPSGNYQVTVEDLSTGCQIVEQITID